MRCCRLSLALAVTRRRVFMIASRRESASLRRLGDHLLLVVAAFVLLQGGSLPARSQTPQAVRAGSPGVGRPLLTKFVPPVYPQGAQDAEIQGIVFLEIVIGVDGTVTEAKVVTSIPGLDEAAMAAVRQREYTPTLLNGVPVPVITRASVEFTLPADALLDALVWGTYFHIAPSAYSPELQGDVERYRDRFEAYYSNRRPSANLRTLEEIVYGMQIRYEGQLVAISDDPRAPALAAAYVESLRPCYEWEGYHGCPEREAVFAEEYRATHPSAPFGEYLPLLAAHRWLCTAEAYDYEKRPDDAARSRRAYEQAISIAQKSSLGIIRAAAEGLMARGSCFSAR